MPFRKKSNLSRSSSKARESKRTRLEESQEERQNRLEHSRVQNASSRSSETQLERQSRLSSQRERQTIVRSLENVEQQQSRLSSQRERQYIARSLENFERRESRLSSQLERQADARSGENIEQRESRLTSQRERQIIARTLETDEQRETRLNVQRERQTLSRSLETIDQHDQRLATARQRYHNVIEEVIDNLSQERERISQFRQSQTHELREIQLEEDRERHEVYRLPDEEVQYNEQPWIEKNRSGFNYNVLVNYADYANVGAMSVICTSCQALKWRGESKGLCCSSGKVRLERIQEPPEPLKSLLNGEHRQSKHFLDNIRAYNSAFQMTSFGANQITEGPFMPTFKIQGQVYHLIGSLLPTDVPKFLQIYFISDFQEQANVRRQYIPNLDADIINELQAMLHNINPYVNSFKAALEYVPNNSRNDFKFVINADRRPTGNHAGRYNAPTTNEVAVLLIDQESDKRDIVLRSRDDRLQRISETHRSYDSLQYPLMLCRGEDGYNFAVYNVNPQTGESNFNKKTSSLQFYNYLIQVRFNEYTHLHRFRTLFSQFLVDEYAKIETERLVFIRTNQKKLRVDSYVDLQDAMQQDVDGDNLGRMVILPSSFTGGPRYMHQRTQDAFCYVRKYGRPDLFITITTNPKWREITQELLPGQMSYDRHDIVSRVFHLKLKKLMDLLTKENIFGATRCYMYSVEWQKRGLPHAHILIWLEDKLRPNQIDQVISAELPDPQMDPVLHNIIKTHMIHGPCGTLNVNSPCMKDSHCSKRFPKKFVNETITGEDGYPSYRRRSPQDGGFTTEINMRGQPIVLDNRWVVPYSPVLSRTFTTHINVESCSSVQSIKYICKYINKGSDQATFGLQNANRDEVTKYQSGRYISTSEAAWRIFAFSIHERYPTVMHLDIHLENAQRVYFDAENIRERLENPRQTTLLAFFRLCQYDEFAKTLLYNEIASYYTYDQRQGIFNRRKRGIPVEGYPGIFKDSALGRVYTVHPNNNECFHLRLLLHTVRGPTSFLALKTVEGTEYPTFQDACRALRLLEDDQHWDQTLEEATVSDSPSRLRHLFAILLVFCGLSNPLQLWEKYLRHLSEDYLREERRVLNNNIDEPTDRVINRCLCSLEENVISMGGNPLAQYGLPVPQLNMPRLNRDYSAETNYNPVEMTNIVNTNIDNLNLEQREIYNKVIQSVSTDLGKMFFLDAPGGTGKTYLTKIILAEIRRQGKIALAVASSGIAATLLPGGKTAHTMFKIPIDLDSHENPICAISRNSDRAAVFRDCCLIVWDECTMANKKAVEAVNRTLQDIRKNNRLMGGITILFCGDFRQTLPVVTRGTRADEINSCLKRSALWLNIQKLSLTTNMRVQQGGNVHAREFSEVLLKIGNGTLPAVNNIIQLTQILCQTVLSVDVLIQSVYGDVAQIRSKDNNWMCERAILAPTNEQAAAINNNILTQIEGDEVIYTSINTVIDQDDATNYPTEFLASLSAGGLPAHKIALKVGVPIMLLRNLSPPKLCNGTRLKIVSLQRNVIEATILTGCATGENVFIPRIPIIPNNFPFQFKRVQFPVTVCFAMTINKSQGQTLRTAGVDLRRSCFSHGQLYVACSRVSSSDNLYILATDNQTTNIVYKEIFS